MNERFVSKLFPALEVAQIAAFAVAGTFFAFSAGGHEVLAEHATSATVMHDEEQSRNHNLIPAALMEVAAVASGINAVRRKSRS